MKKSDPEGKHEIRSEENSNKYLNLTKHGLNGNNYLVCRI